MSVVKEFRSGDANPFHLIQFESLSESPEPLSHKFSQISWKKAVYALSNLANSNYFWSTGFSLESNIQVRQKFLIVKRNIALESFGVNLGHRLELKYFQLLEHMFFSTGNASNRSSTSEKWKQRTCHSGRIFKIKLLMPIDGWSITQ